VIVRFDGTPSKPGTGLLGNDPVPRDAGEKLLREHAFDHGQEGFDQRAHMVEIPLQDATPDAWAVSHHDRKRIEQHEGDGPIGADPAQDRLDERGRRKRAVVQRQGIPPNLSLVVIHGRPKARPCRPGAIRAISLIGQGKVATSSRRSREDASVSAA